MAGTAQQLARRLEGQRKRARVSVETAERTLTIGGVAAALGFAERRGFVPVSIANMPTKLVLGVVLSFFAAKSSGATRRLASAAGDTSLAVYSYAAGKAGGFIAGEEDDEL